MALFTLNKDNFVLLSNQNRKNARRDPLLATPDFWNLRAPLVLSPLLHTRKNTSLKQESSEEAGGGSCWLGSTWGLRETEAQEDADL